MLSHLMFLFYLFSSTSLFYYFFPLLPLILFYIIATEAFHTIYVSAFLKIQFQVKIY